MTPDTPATGAKQILILSTSPRPHGNSELLADAFADGAAAAGHTCEKLILPTKKIDYCIGCMACAESAKCVLRDDVPSILEKMAAADALVFASPIYFYSVSGQLKTLLDRTNPLYESGEYSFREVYLLTACASGEASAGDGAVRCIEGWLRCYGKARLAGAMNAAGVKDKGSVETVRGGAYLRAAFEMGRSVPRKLSDE